MDGKIGINLVLSGGSARGLAHIGVLSVLEKHFHIKSIIGTSMGAIIGGLYACGLSPEEMLKLAEPIHKVKLLTIFKPSSNKSILKIANLLRMFKPSFKKSGLTDGEGVLKFLEELSNGINISQCKIPFAAVAYDLNSNRSVVIDKGSLAKAMRASSSLPFVFQPFAYGKYLFVDGYIEHPLPIKYANYYQEEGLTVACSVLPPVPPQYEVFQDGETDKKQEIPSMLDVFFQTNFYSQGSTVLDALLQSKPDIYISAYDDDLDFWDLKEIDNFYELGRNAAEKAINDYNSDQEHSLHRQFLKGLYDSYTDFRRKVKKQTD